MRLLPLTLILVGCSGSTSVDAPASAPTSEAGAPDAEPGIQDAGVDSALPKADAGDAGPKDTRIDPIAVGRSWTYSVQVIGWYPLCQNGTFTSNATQEAMLDGKTAIDVQSFCPSVGIVKYAVEGDTVFSRVAGEWIRSIDAPVQQGHEWTDGYRSYRWESRGSVTVAAGKFDDCWSATTIASYTSYITLCRGVGPVKWHFEDGLGNGYEAILTAKNF